MKLFMKRLMQMAGILGFAQGYAMADELEWQSISSERRKITVVEENFYPKNLATMSHNLHAYLLNKIDEECPDSETITVENPTMQFSSFKLGGHALVGTIRRTPQGLHSAVFPQSRASLTATVTCK